jgi:hypothetical protein
MTPHDRERFRDFVDDFVRDSGIAPPRHIVAIGANGSVDVQFHASDGKVEHVCARVIGAGFTGPISVTVIGTDGGASARINIEAARATVQ